MTDNYKEILKQSYSNLTDRTQRIRRILSYYKRWYLKPEELARNNFHLTYRRYFTNGPVLLRELSKLERIKKDLLLIIYG